MTRQIVLDTETTGLDPSKGHRIIEIGCVELIDRRITNNFYHQYIDPQRAIDEGAVSVHGLDQAFLAGKPVFAELVDGFLQYIADAELIIHNAAFDVGFLDAELARFGKKYKPVHNYCAVIDTLALARQQHPGQRNSLDALCKRYEIDNSERDLHGALLDARLLARVYLAMTTGQRQLFNGASSDTHAVTDQQVVTHVPLQHTAMVQMANETELKAHNDYVEFLQQQSENGCLWETIS
jgi:DNA polymerase-3 subunit epsilon